MAFGHKIFITNLSRVDDGNAVKELTFDFRPFEFIHLVEKEIILLQQAVVSIPIMVLASPLAQFTFDMVVIFTRNKIRGRDIKREWSFFHCMVSLSNS